MTFRRASTCFCLFPNSSSTPPTRPFIVRHLSSWFCTPDTLAIPGLHTPKYWCSRLWVWPRGFLVSSVIFHRSFLSANSSVIRLLCCLIYPGSLFNGPLYIPVVSLALLTEGRTARDLPKQRWSKKKEDEKGNEQLNKHSKLKRPSEDWKLAECPRFADLTRESKATSESAQKDRQVSNTRRSQAFETRPPQKEDGWSRVDQRADAAKMKRAYLQEE